MSDIYSTPFKVLLCRDRDPADGLTCWTAHCLERDVAASGRSPAAAMDSLRRCLVGQIALDQQDGREPLVDFEPAPPEFWRRYENPGADEQALTIDLSAVPPGQEEFAAELHRVVDDFCANATDKDIDELLKKADAEFYNQVQMPPGMYLVGLTKPDDDTKE